MQATKPIPHGRLVVTATLSKLGEQEPYFSITAEEYDNRVRRDNGVVACGCMHERIREVFGDRFDDLIALHLSEMVSGAPMHAEENGWYWLAGACGGLGEQFHGGNQKYPTKPPLEIFAAHCRIHIDTAHQLREACLRAAAAADMDTKSGRASVRAVWTEFCTAQRPRWAREAGEAIAKHGLTVTTR